MRSICCLALAICAIALPSPTPTSPPMKTISSFTSLTTPTSIFCLLRRFSLSFLSLGSMTSSGGITLVLSLGLW